MNASRGGALNHIVTQIVALADTVWDVKVGRTAAKFDGGFQNDDGHRSINIVIAIDEDGFFAFNGRVDAVDGGAQARHLFRGVQMINGW
jgi:hypothetical protein